MIIKQQSRLCRKKMSMIHKIIMHKLMTRTVNFKKAFVSVPNVVEESQTESSDGKKWLNWSQGIGYIMKQFGDILKAHQIEEIKTVGEMFDPRMHDSVGEEVSEMPEHTIIREIDGGYIMKGKVVKVAKVIVAKKAD